MIKWIQQESD